MATKKKNEVSLSDHVRSESRARELFRELAGKKKWDTRHPQKGGDFLEENEIEDFYTNIGLGLERPDFLLTNAKAPVATVEVKNDYYKLPVAIKEATDYADKINAHGKYKIRLAIGFAGEKDKGYCVEVQFKSKSGWVVLTSHNHPITAVPSKIEVEEALRANNGSTIVAIPEQSEFIESAMELSVVLRQAKIEPSLRPRVIGALVAAMYQGKIDPSPSKALSTINMSCAQAINGANDIDAKKKKLLIETLKLSGANYSLLAPHIGRVISILERLNIRSVLQTDTDFLGMFYEAFLRYGYDNNALGIVFTPRHITRFCVELLNVNASDMVIDLASGTGGFLVAAFDKMLSLVKSQAQKDAVRNNISGFDTNPQIWALSTLNMFFRGDGKSAMENGNCLDDDNRLKVRQKFTKAFLNPPFSQKNEPEKAFIDASMNALKPEGLLAAVVYSGVFADDEHKKWRKDFLSKHTLLGMISLPDELFYPTGAPTSIIIAQAHIPHPNKGNAASVFMSKVINDGYEKLKGKRVVCSGNQLGEVGLAFQSFLAKKTFSSQIATSINGSLLMEGQEWCPEHWLPQSAALVKGGSSNYEKEALSELFRAVAHFPTLADLALPSFGSQWKSLPALPKSVTEPLSYFFNIHNGKSSGEKNYSEGAIPYISSGDATNSIVSLLNPPDKDEVFSGGGISITAFGQACIQPWDFIARGNGGSSARILTPKFNMSVREMIWFVAQINMQRWRFFYARMAIKGRLGNVQFKLTSPPKRLPDGQHLVSSKLLDFRNEMSKQSVLW